MDSLKSTIRDAQFYVHRLQLLTLIIVIILLQDNYRKELF